MMPTPIDALLAAVARAETNQATDEEQARIDLGKKFGHKVINLIDQYAGPDRLTTIQVERVLAGILGYTIKSCRIGGPLSGAIVAAELCQIILDLATEEF